MKCIYLLALVQFSIGSSCQSKKIDRNDMSLKAKQQAIKLAVSLINRKADSVIGFHYPKLVEMWGGKLQAIASVEKSWLKNDVDSIKIISDSIGDPSKIIFFKGQYQCTIPQQMIMSIKNQKVAVESTLVALSMDEGETWYFIDAANDGFKKIKSIFPEISTELEVAKQGRPKILNNSN